VDVDHVFENHRLRSVEKSSIEEAGANGGTGALTLNEQRKQRLSERLRSLMDEKGLSVSVAARLVQEQLPGLSFNAANISHYRAGRSMPRPIVLKALSAVLEVDPEELSPSLEAGGKTAAGKKASPQKQAKADPRSETSVALPEKGGPNNNVPQFHITDLPDGEALLQINQKLSWSTVIRILQVLKGEIKGGD
jgi:transcriptional regulator with XRE-family HTH domain